MQESNIFYTIEEAAEKLKVSERYLREQINDGKLIAHKKGKRYYIFQSDIADWIRLNEN